MFQATIYIGAHALMRAATCAYTRARTHQTHTACAHKRSFRRRGLGGLRTFQQRVGRLHDVFAGLEKVRAARLHAQLHGELCRTGVLVPQGDVSVFTSDYAFGSASGAAAVVCGRPSNGTLEWKVQGQAATYKEWEANRLSDATQ